jgi:hypothetical protein
MVNERSKREKELRTLAGQIRLLTRDNPHRTFLVKQYNEELDDSLPLLEGPLPAEAELGEDEILAEYREFKINCKRRSPHPFADFCASKSLIARAIIKSVSWRGTRVKGKIQELLKGEVSEQVEFTPQRVYMPTPWFSRGGECLIFLDRQVSRTGRPKFYIFSDGGRMPVLRGPEGNFVLSFNSRDDFWNGFEYSALDTAGYDSVKKLRLEPVIAAIKKQAVAAE